MPMLLTRTRYNAKGEPFEMVDPKGIVTRSEFDALGRQVRTIQNYLSGSTDPDANVTVEYTYNAGRLAALTAVNPATGNQTTRYEYGVSPATGSLVSRNDLLRETIYPDGGLDAVKNRYNRQGERIGMTDQNGTVHAYERDKLGRMTADEVTSLGTGIDGAVRKLGTTYNARGLVEKLTSYGPTGSVVNEVKNTYNGLNQLTEQAQSHAGAVTGGTPKVEYGYDHSASGGVFTKGARPTDVTYPSGRVIDFDYGSAGGAGDKLGRIEALVDGAQTLVSYSYLGVGTFVITDYVEPQVKLDYTAAASGDAKYPGFDQYNRVVQHHWTAYGASPGLRDGFDYGYDANSNRLWRANLTAQALDKPFDELYAYDRLNRLVDFQRGTLNAEHTAILGTPTKEQIWNLDATGNWSHFTSADDGVLETDQTRISNPANEITEISSWFPPGYDHAGNMTRIPKPAAPQEGFLATWDAWNRMVKVVDAGTGDTVQENAFDAQIWRTVRKDYEAGSLSETRHFFYTAQWQSIEERLDAATTPERQHVWGLRYIDDLILRDRDTDDDGDLDERLYAMQDANWNVTSIVDNAGVVQERLATTPFGTRSVYTDEWSSIGLGDRDWDIIVTGYLLDDATSLYFVRYRQLHSQFGRWLTRDPMGYIESSSLYAYGIASLLSYTDAYGLLDPAVEVAACYYACEEECSRLFNDSSLISFMLCRHECARTCRANSGYDPGSSTIIVAITEFFGIAKPLPNRPGAAARPDGAVPALVPPGWPLVKPIGTPGLRPGSPATQVQPTPTLGPAVAVGIGIDILVQPIELPKPKPWPGPGVGPVNPPPPPPPMPQRTCATAYPGVPVCNLVEAQDPGFFGNKGRSAAYWCSSCNDGCKTTVGRSRVMQEGPSACPAPFATHYTCKIPGTNQALDSIISCRCCEELPAPHINYVWKCAPKND